MQSSAPACGMQRRLPISNCNERLTFDRASDRLFRSERDGVAHWLEGSVAEAVFRRSGIPTLFIAPGARGFVDQVSGDVKLRRALVPVDFSPPAGRTVETIQRFGRLLTGASLAVDLLHVGDAAPPVGANAPGLLPVIVRSGHVAQSIVDAAIEFDADLIAMPTAGHHGVLDALRGSTTARVIPP